MKIKITNVKSCEKEHLNVSLDIECTSNNKTYCSSYSSCGANSYSSRITVGCSGVDIDGKRVNCNYHDKVDSYSDWYFYNYIFDAATSSSGVRTISIRADAYDDLIAVVRKARKMITNLENVAIKSIAEKVKDNNKCILKKRKLLGL